VAVALSRESGDDENALGDASVRLVQTQLFKLLIDSEGAFETKDLAKIGHVLADLARAGVAQKKWQTAVRERVAKVAEDVETEIKQAGLTDEKAALIRAKIFGIAA
jgi:hypothetical protein